MGNDIGKNIGSDIGRDIGNGIRIIIGKDIGNSIDEEYSYGKNIGVGKNEDEDVVKMESNPMRRMIDKKILKEKEKVQIKENEERSVTMEKKNEGVEEYGSDENGSCERGICAVGNSLQVTTTSAVTTISAAAVTLETDNDIISYANPVNAFNKSKISKNTPHQNNTKTVEIIPPKNDGNGNTKTLTPKNISPLIFSPRKITDNRKVQKCKSSVIIDDKESKEEKKGEEEGEGGKEGEKGEAEGEEKIEEKEGKKEEGEGEEKEGEGEKVILENKEISSNHNYLLNQSSPNNEIIVIVESKESKTHDSTEYTISANNLRNEIDKEDIQENVIEEIGVKNNEVASDNNENASYNYAVKTPYYSFSPGLQGLFDLKNELDRQLETLTCQKVEYDVINNEDYDDDNDDNDNDNNTLSYDNYHTHSNDDIICYSNDNMRNKGIRKRSQNEIIINEITNIDSYCSDELIFINDKNIEINISKEESKEGYEELKKEESNVNKIENSCITPTQFDRKTRKSVNDDNDVGEKNRSKIPIFKQNSEKGFLLTPPRKQNPSISPKNGFRRTQSKIPISPRKRIKELSYDEINGIYQQEMLTQMKLQLKQQNDSEIDIQKQLKDEKKILIDEKTKLENEIEKHKTEFSNKKNEVFKQKENLLEIQKERKIVYEELQQLNKLKFSMQEDLQKLQSSIKSVNENRGKVNTVLHTHSNNITNTNANSVQLSKNDINNNHNNINNNNNNNNNHNNDNNNNDYNNNDDIRRENHINNNSHNNNNHSLHSSGMTSTSTSTSNSSSSSNSSSTSISKDKQHIYQLVDALKIAKSAVEISHTDLTKTQNKIIECFSEIDYLQNENRLLRINLKKEMDNNINNNVTYNKKYNLNYSNSNNINNNNNNNSNHVNDDDNYIDDKSNLKNTDYNTKMNINYSKTHPVRNSAIDRKSTPFSTSRARATVGVSTNSTYNNIDKLNNYASNSIGNNNMRYKYHS